MKQFKILSFNEWKESPSYIYQSFFSDLKKKFESFFVNYDELTFDYFEYDSTVLLGQVQIAYLFFNEKEITYKIEIIVDVETVEDDNIEKLDFIMYGYDLESGDELGQLKTEVNVDEITEDLIIRLIDEFKEENIDPNQEQHKPIDEFN